MKKTLSGTRRNDNDRFCCQGFYILHARRRSAPWLRLMTVSFWLLSHCTIHLIIRELYSIRPSFLFPFLISYFHFYS